MILKKRVRGERRYKYPHDLRSVFEVHWELVSVPAEVWRSGVRVDGTKHTKSAMITCTCIIYTLNTGTALYILQRSVGIGKHCLECVDVSGYCQVMLNTFQGCSHVTFSLPIP